MDQLEKRIPEPTQTDGHVRIAARAVLLDFDGTITLNSGQLFIRALAQEVSRHGYMPEAEMTAMVEGVAAFHMGRSIGFLLAELGLRAETDNLIRAATEAIQCEMQLREGAQRFVHRLDRERTWWLSSSLLRPNDLLGTKFERLPLGERSKADPATFRWAAEHLQCAPADVVMFDDRILVLRAAKLAGLGTVLVRPPGAPLGSATKDLIDREIDSFEGVEVRFLAAGDPADAETAGGPARISRRGTPG